MLQSIQDLLERVSKLFADRPLFCGFLLGLAVAFAILLLLFLISLLFRSRKLHAIVIPSPDGDLRIDAKAVQGAVRALAEKHPAFTIRKVALFGKQTAVGLRVEMDFNGGDASVSALAAQFRAAIARMMTDMFGMEKPARIELEILRSAADADVPSGSRAADAGSGDGDGSASVETPAPESGSSC